MLWEMGDGAGNVEGGGAAAGEGLLCIGFVGICFFRLSKRAAWMGWDGIEWKGERDYVDVD